LVVGGRGRPKKWPKSPKNLAEPRAVAAVLPAQADREWALGWIF